MKTLLIDTSLGGIALGYYDSTSDQASAQYLQTVRGQAEQLIPMVQAILNDHKAVFADLGQIITTVGPGSFTGLRLGLSAAKSLSLALGIPVYGLSTLQALAQSYLLEQPATKGGFAVLIETKRPDYYAQIFTANGQAFNPPQALPLDQLEAALQSIDADVQVITGDACTRFLKESQSESKPDHTPLERINAEALARILTQNPETLLRDVEPLYLRGADVSEPKHTPRSVADA